MSAWEYPGPDTEAVSDGFCGSPRAAEFSYELKTDDWYEEWKSWSYRLEARPPGVVSVIFVEPRFGNVLVAVVEVAVIEPTVHGDRVVY